MNVEELIEIAQNDANHGFDRAVGLLAEAAKDDPAALTEAAHKLSTATKSAGTREHIAFTYIAAAFKKLTTGTSGDE